VHGADGAADALRRLNMVARSSGFDLAGVGSSSPSVSVDTTDWLIARLPALAIATMRSPGLGENVQLAERSRHCRGRHWYGYRRS